ncbi:restriction endonuclease subunit S [Sutcliffiella sp. NPDC057660]|uniref:restriction endonuclease subunit S n=1 Tax=Sutcliffiella sp. NPDC057660 TaxID=3346199 RepID=UPI0036A2ABCA
MKSQFTKFRLGDIAEVQTGPFGSQLHQKDYVEKGTPIITVEHLGDNRIIHNNMPKVSEEDKERLSKYQIFEGDIVFSRVGSVDRRAYVTKKEDGWLFSGRCLRVRVKDSRVSSLYLSYYFGLESFKEYIRRIAVGATMPSINTQILKDIEIQLPSIEYQLKVADNLFSIDEMIENNKEINKTLEVMVHSLYKHYFVNFGPFKDGNFIDSEQGEIPEGWKIVSNKDVFEFAYGKALRKKDRVLGNVPVIGSGGQVDWHDTPIVKGPSIVVGRKGNAGTITWVDEDYYPIDTTFYINNNLISIYYLYFALHQQHLEDKGTDSAVPGLNREVAYSQKLILPPDSVVQEFENKVKALFDKIAANNRENYSLIETRNYLLQHLLLEEGTSES